ncbi:MAG: hypothetical protein HYX75_01725, partial [Acidobacteria bacterium]|nr:hypothetical protein [Acidobacteriota bacterium]
KPQTTDIQPALMLASLAFIMVVSGVLILYLGVAPAQFFRTIETSLASLHQLIPSI